VYFCTCSSNVPSYLMTPGFSFCWFLRKKIAVKSTNLSYKCSQVSNRITLTKCQKNILDSLNSHRYNISDTFFKVKNILYSFGKGSIITQMHQVLKYINLIFILYFKYYLRNPIIYQV